MSLKKEGGSLRKKNEIRFKVCFRCLSVMSLLLTLCCLDQLFSVPVRGVYIRTSRYLCQPCYHQSVGLVLQLRLVVLRLQQILDGHILYRNPPAETLEQVGLWREPHVFVQSQWRYLIERKCSVFHHTQNREGWTTWQIHVRHSLHIKQKQSHLVVVCIYCCMALMFELDG